MSGYMIYLSKEYMDKLLGKGETVSVVYGGYSTQLPSLKKIRKGDTVYPVTVFKNALYAVGRLTIENIEPAFDYLMRETGKLYNCIFPDDYAVRCTYNDAPYIPRDKAGKHFKGQTSRNMKLSKNFPKVQKS